METIVPTVDYLVMRCRSNTPPPAHGVYLLLCYEWIGGVNDKPEKPSWVIKLWKGEWARKRYTFDTGGWENFEAVRWCELPPVS